MMEKKITYYLLLKKKGLESHTINLFSVIENFSLMRATFYQPELFHVKTKNTLN